MTDAADAVAEIQDRADAALSDETVVHGIIRAGTLRQFVDTLLPLVAEGRVHFGDHGIRTRVVDPANVATYMPVELDAAAFEHFDAPGQVTIGVDLQTLADRLSFANSNDLVSMAVDMETRKLELHYRNIEQSVALIDSEAIRSEPDHPDLDLPNSVTITGEDFATAVKVADEVGDHVTIEGRPDEACARFHAAGDVDDAVVTFGREETIDAKVGEHTDTILSLEYLAEFAQPMPDDAEVTIQYGDEFPIIFDYETCDGHLSVHGMQAPRIQN